MHLGSWLRRFECLKNAAARQSQRFIRRSWHNVCVTHCLSAQEAVSGGTMSKNYSRTLRGKVRGGASTDSTCVQRSPVPAGIYMCIDMYVEVCVCVCVCVRARVYVYAYVCWTSEIGRYICMYKFACLRPCMHVGHGSIVTALPRVSVAAFTHG